MQTSWTTASFMVGCSSERGPRRLERVRTRRSPVAAAADLEPALFAAARLLAPVPVSAATLRDALDSWSALQLFVGVKGSGVKLREDASRV